MATELDGSSVEVEKKPRKRKPINLPPKHDPLAIVRKAKEMGIREVIVSFSGGKDSLATLQICVEHFERVVPFFMYIVKGLEFQERFFRYVESRYELEILRVPDWRLGMMLRDGVFRHFTKQAASIRAVRIRDVEHAIRERTGIHWVASGETVYESLSRRGMIQSVDGICPRRGHIYPVGFWRPQDVMSYLSMRDITLPSDYRIIGAGGSFGGLRMRQIAAIKREFPDDYDKIKRLFPLINAQLVRLEASKFEEYEEPEAGMVDDE